MKIKKLQIINFRGIKSLDCTLDEQVVCLIGAGNSSKSTILDAIQYALSPSWFIPADDSDFYNCNPANRIKISVTVSLVDDFLSDSKFGLLLQGWNKEQKKLVDDPSDDNSLEKVVTIEFVMDSDLSPEWKVVTVRDPEGKNISAKDRQALGVSRIGENIAGELSWSRGSALSKLTASTGDSEFALLEAMRSLGKKVEDVGLDEFTEVLKLLEVAANQLGVNFPNPKPLIDPSSLRARAALFSLFSGNVPARLLGLGSRRLLAIAAQLQCANKDGVLLIDEIETALEPHKIKHLIRTLKREEQRQFIFTSHHASVIEELGCGSLFSVAANNAGSVTVKKLPADIQGTVRSMPESLLASKVVVCEGDTEVGILRAFEAKRLTEEIKTTFAFNQVAVVNARGGSTVKGRAKDLLEAGKEVAVFMDSDKPENVPDDISIKLLVWNGKNCTETAIIKKLSGKALKGVVGLAVELNTSQSVFDCINANAGALAPLTQEYYSSLPDTKIEEYADTIAQAAKSGRWFKCINDGERLGDLLFGMEASAAPEFFEKMNKLKAWVCGEKSP